MLRRWIVPQEGFAEAERTERQAATDAGTPFSKLHDLHTAAAKVEHHSVIDRQPTNSTCTAVIGFFIGVNHLNFQAKLVSNPGNEVPSVLSITHGRCGDSKDTP